MDLALVLLKYEKSFSSQLIQASCKLDKFDYNSINYCDNIHNHQEA